MGACRCEETGSRRLMMQVPTPLSSPPGGPVSQPTFSAGSILADTIVRTVELGVTITDAAIDGETTVVWCELRATGPGRCPAGFQNPAMCLTCGFRLRSRTR